MMIELGLQRISKLLQGVKLPWRAIHVAGTNGKGSVCAYASAILHRQGVSCGRFTSPHLIDRWDCITINDKTVEKDLFLEVESHFSRKNEKNDIQATEFELLTATAFEIFSRARVEVGVVEVGMGGALDATNVLKKPFHTVITKIGYDHEHYLGNDLIQIASHKAGIMKKGVPCIIDRTNRKDVLEFLIRHAKTIKAPFSYSAGEDIEPYRSGHTVFDDIVLLTGSGLERHQHMNLSLAFIAVDSTLRQLGKRSPGYTPVMEVAETTAWPGRQQYLSIEPLTGRKENILLDGAHNLDSYEALRTHVDKKLRPKISSHKVTWVLACSEGKPNLFFNHLVKPADNMVTVEFGPVDGMPWVKAKSAQDIENLLVDCAEPAQNSSKSTDVRAALQWATDASKGGPMVVAGSLYLVSDVLRLLRVEQRTNETG